MKELIEYGIKEALALAKARSEAHNEPIDSYIKSTYVHVRVIPQGMINAGGFEIVEFDGHGFYTRVWANGRVAERGVVAGRMGWL